MDKIMIAISDFSTYPSGRTDKDGSFNGTKFRTEVLVPALVRAIEGGSKVVVSLAGVMSFGSSFLEEAFGGLVREKVFSKSTIKRAIEIDAGAKENERYREAILRYIDRA